MRTFIATYHPHYKELIHIGIPIVIGQIGIVLVGLADNIMVGRYDTLHLAEHPYSFRLGILLRADTVGGAMLRAKGQIPHRAIAETQPYRQRAHGSAADPRHDCPLL